MTSEAALHGAASGLALALSARTRTDRMLFWDDWVRVQARLRPFVRSNAGPVAIMAVAAEDLATGSAGVALAGHLMAAERPADGGHRYVVEQGFVMGRPSQIELTLEVAGGALRGASIGGEAVPVSEGTLL